MATRHGTFEFDTETTPDNGFRPPPPLPPLSWISPKVTEILKAHPEFLALLPLRELLTDPPPPASTKEERLSWFAKNFAHHINVDNAPDVTWGPLLPMPELMDVRPPANGQ